MSSNSDRLWCHGPSYTQAGHAYSLSVPRSAPATDIKIVEILMPAVMKGNYSWKDSMVYRGG